MSELAASVFEAPAGLDKAHRLAPFFSRLGLTAESASGPDTVDWTRYLVKGPYHDLLPFPIQRLIPELDVAQFRAELDDLSAQLRAEMMAPIPRPQAARSRYFGDMTSNRVGAFLVQEERNAVDTRIWQLIKYLFLAGICLRPLSPPRIEEEATSLRLIAEGTKVPNPAPGETLTRLSDARRWYVSRVLGLAPGSMDDRSTPGDHPLGELRSRVDYLIGAVNAGPGRLGASGVTTPKALADVIDTMNQLAAVASTLLRKPQGVPMGPMSVVDSSDVPSADTDLPAEVAEQAGGAPSHQSARDRSPTPSSKPRTVRRNRSIARVSTEPASQGEPDTAVKAFEPAGRQQATARPTTQQKLQRFWLRSSEDTNRLSAPYLSSSGRRWLKKLVQRQDLDVDCQKARQLIIAQILCGEELRATDDAATLSERFQRLALGYQTISLPIPDSLKTPDETERFFFNPLLRSVQVPVPGIASAYSAVEHWQHPGAVEKAYRSLLMDLRAVNGGRLENKSLSRLLAHEAFLNTRNLLFKGSLSQSEDYEMPAMAWYLGLNEDRVRDAYEAACRSLLGLEVGKEVFTPSGSGATVWEPVDTKLAAAIARARRDAEQAVSSAGVDLVERHRRYTHYTLWLLQFSVGYRPVRDPMGVVTHICRDNGFCVLCDKVMQWGREFRIAQLGRVARQQLDEYFRYLRWLSTYLAGTPEWAPIALAVKTLLDGSGHPTIPLFFSLSYRDSCSGRKGLRVGHLDTAHQRDAIAEYAPIPANEGRRWMASRLDRAGVPYGWIAAALGHNDQIHHHFGKLSLHSPSEVLGRIASETDQLLLEAGFEPVKVKLRKGKELRRRATDALSIQSGIQPVLVTPAHQERRRLRHQQTVAHRRLVDERFEHFALRCAAQPPSIDDVKALYQEAIQTSVSKQLPVHRTVMLITRRLRMLRRQGIAIPRTVFLPLPPEASPFGENTMISYRVARTAALRLDELLNDLSARHKKGSANATSVDQRNALAVLTAALKSGMSDERRLAAILAGDYQLLWIDKELHLVLSKRASFIGSNGQRVEETVESVVALDVVTAALIRSLARAATSPRKARSLSYLRQFATALGLDVEKKEPLAVTSNAAAELQRLQCSGLVTSVLSGNLLHRSLPVKAIARLCTGKPLDGYKPDDLREPIPVSGVAATQVSAADGHAAAEIRWVGRLLSRITRSISAAHDQPLELQAMGGSHARLKAPYREPPALTGATRQARMAAFLEWLLEEGLAEDIQPRFSRSQLYLIRFVIDQCRARTHARAWRTIEEYYQIVIRSLSRHLEHDLGDLSEAHFEELYFMALDEATTRRRQKTAVALRHFHSFIHRSFGTAAVDWSYVYALGDWEDGDPAASIDANYIFSSEYRLALNYLQESDLTGSVRDQLSMLLILGARFGQRWSEALHIQRRDLRCSGWASGMTVHVRPGRKRALKTRSAERYIPLVGYLNDRESAIVRRVVERYDQRYQHIKARQRPGLLDRFVADDADVSPALASRIVNTALRTATGDAGTRFHHLRHTFCSALLMIALAPTVGRRSALYSTLEHDFLSTLGLPGPSWPELWGDEPAGLHSLRTVSSLMGHASPETSIRAYAHFWDLYAQSCIDTATLIDDSLLSFAAGLPYATVVKRRQRQAARDSYHYRVFIRDTARKQGVNLATLVSGCAPERLHGLPTLKNGHQLLEMNSACLWLLASNGKRGALRDVCSLNALDEKVFRQAAVKAERTTGYDIFSLRTLVQGEPPITRRRPVTPGERENLAVREVLSVMQQVMDCFDDLAWQSVRTGLEALCKGRGQRLGGRVTFPLDDDLNAVDAAAGLLGWNDLLIPVARPAETGRHRPSELAETYRNGRSYQLAIPEPLSTVKAFWRVVFLVYLTSEYALQTGAKRQ